MIDHEFSLNDTLANFSFNDIKCDLETNISDGVSFDDSTFLENISLELERLVKTSYNTEPVKSTQKSFDNPEDDNEINTEPQYLEDIEKTVVSPTPPQIEETKPNICENLSEESNCKLSTWQLLKATNDENQNLKLAEEPNYELSAWQLPKAVLDKYAARNISKMFPWQFECLNNPKIITDLSNLIYSAPTSAGKTLVAEILALKTIFDRRKKVIFILPFVSIVREKMYYFQDILGSSGIRADGFMGSYNPPGGFSMVNFAICTIEKANSLINRLLEEGRLSEVGAIFVDEMHLLGDPNRGYLLELLLTKLRYICIKDETIQIQIIGMSATLPNLDQLAKWLGAELFCTTFRPIPLHEQVSISGEIYDKNLQFIRKVEPLPDIGVDTDNVLQLCLDTIKESCSVLIFCPTKNWCENLAQQLSMAFFKIGNSTTPLGELLRTQIKGHLIQEVLEQLSLCPSGLDSVLKKSVSFGIAFHHAGLTMDERDIIEAAFRNGAIKVLVATSTLSSGVNLPARRVIIRSPVFCGKPLDLLTYRQMIGRAGRMGRDTKGESVLICQKSDSKLAQHLMRDELPPVESCLEGAGKLKRAILEVIASGVASSPEDITLFTNCTLLATTSDFVLQNPIEEAVEFLTTYEFIRLQNGKYHPTSLGKACLSSSIAPDEGLALFTELEKARQCFVLETELHLIYLVTPYSACNSWGNIDWMFFWDLWDKLPRAMKKVGELVGVSESFIINATRGKTDTSTSKAYHRMLVHKRFFVSLALQDLVNEVPLAAVCAKFNCNRGMLQSLQQSASTFAGMVTSFSRQLGWSSVELLLAQFQDRMQFGVSRDLLDLMRLPCLNGRLARTLYKAGIETLIQLASSNVDEVENVLYKARPFERSKDVAQLRTVWIAGKDGLTEREAAELLVKDARCYLVMEMGLKEARWSQEENVGEVEVKSCEDVAELKKEDSENSLLKKEDVAIEQNGEEGAIDEDDENVVSQGNSNKEATEPETGEDKEEAKNEDPNSSETSLFSYREPGLKSNESFTLQLSSDEALSSHSIDEFISQGTFELAVQNFDFSPETSYVKKRSRDSSIVSSDDSFLIATPKKKSKPNQDPRTPFSSTIKRYSRLSLREKPQVSELTSLEELNRFVDRLDTVTTFSFCVACSLKEEVRHSIGSHLFNDKARKNANNYGNSFKTKKIDGLAFSWCCETAFYVPSDETEVFEEVLRVVKGVVAEEERCLRMFDAKEQMKLMIRCYGWTFKCKIEDLKVLDWLVDPEGKEKNLNNMITQYQPDLHSIVDSCSDIYTLTSFGLATGSSVSSKIRATTEALLTCQLTDAMKRHLEAKVPITHRSHLNDFPPIYDLEMQTIKCLSSMEVNGIAVDESSLQKLADLLKKLQISIEKKAYSLAGRRFSFGSSTDVAKVIGTYKGKKVSTKRQVLEQNDHPLSDLVVLWRKINFSLTTMVYPLIRSCEDDRIYGTFVTHTATGRISMHEPNVQMVTKDFSITDPITKNEVLISCRSTFAVKDECLLVSADYCQLELRILTYLSKDEVLMNIMNHPGDIFRSIAAKWNKVAEEQVDDTMRHSAKQLCYGIIYGMGVRTLADQLEVTQEDAAKFMETFHDTYPGIKDFIQDTVHFCKERGHVETITGRRRYLPHIHNENRTISSQAERQAVNTTIQGSAADIVKNAMIIIDNKIKFIFKQSRVKPKLVLHLHDELIYEVPKKHVEKTIKIIKRGMESSAAVLGNFPVKVKSGSSWGNLREHASCNSQSN